MTQFHQAMDWQAHAALFRQQDEGALCLARGALYAMVEIAMVNADDLDDLYIAADDGRMFCRQEIAYIEQLADRPRSGHDH